MQTKVAYAE